MYVVIGAISVKGNIK